MRLALAALVVAAGPAPVRAQQDAGTRYARAYRETGFRLRATYACPGSGKAAAARAMAPVSSREFQAFSRAYPQTIEKWMGEGAGLFNYEVMQDGIAEACRHAR